ncbi:MAG: hypothetical protein JWP97_3497 [Labilithrix sp.]|nr:hypothetical protein [Labilithrix sp.]
MTRVFRAWMAVALAACAPAPRDRAGAAPLPSDGSCASCHAEIAAEQSASFHGRAFSDATFQGSLALEEPGDRPFCTNCHAPDGARAGVSCASCHGREPHAARAGQRAEASCASCHEFTFVGARAELVQKTVSEHAASTFASVSCTECHMPPRSGHRDHGFRSGHDVTRIRDALRVAVTILPGGSAVHVSIATSSGHAFPTGDMFRRARLLVLAEGADGAIVGDATRTFGRTWGAGARPDVRVQTSDTRIRGTWEADLPLEPSAPLRRVRWEVRYERILAVRGAAEWKASSDVVADGVLEP